jgi:hypothetical protein
MHQETQETLEAAEALTTAAVWVAVKEADRLQAAAVKRQAL